VNKRKWRWIYILLAVNLFAPPLGQFDSNLECHGRSVADKQAATIKRRKCTQVRIVGPFWDAGAELVKALESAFCGTRTHPTAPKTAF
jgi:hypothetical protein